MTTFSFRAECPADINTFIHRVVEAQLTVNLVQVKTNQFHEPLVEIATDVSLERLRILMRELTDGHVMLQTLRELPLDQNPLNREYHLE